jgi:hypothetical protein
MVADAVEKPGIVSDEIQHRETELAAVAFADLPVEFPRK